MRCLLMLLAALAALTPPAAAQITTGSQTALGTKFVAVTTFGAKTLPGYGGENFGYTTNGIASIGTVTDASGATVTGVFAVDSGNGTSAGGDIVPCSTSSCTAYGSGTNKLTSSLYTIHSVTPASGAGSAFDLLVNVIPGAASWKSHYGYASGHNPDATNAFQLLGYLDSTTVLSGGEVLYGRDETGTTGLSPGLNPLAQGGSGRYILFPPATGWVANTSNPTYVTCDHSTPGNDGNSNPIYGGQCQIGSLDFSTNTSGDVQIPLKFQYTTFYTDQPTGLNADMLYFNSATGWGITCDYCRFELGPDVSAAEIRIAGVIGFAPHLGGVTHSHFKRLFVAISAGYANNPTAGSIITDNIIEGNETDSIDIANATSGYDIERNFHFSWLTGGPNPQIGDTFSIGAKTYSFVSSITGGGNVDGNVLLANNAGVTFQDILCSINAGGTGCTAGVNYPAAEVADANVVASQGPGYAALVNYSVQVTAIATGTGGNSITVATANTAVSAARATSSFWQNNSSGGSTITTLFGGATGVAAKGFLNLQPDHGDTVQLLLSSSTALPAMTHSYDISVRDVGVPNGDAQQFQFGNYPKNISSAQFQNNISFQVAANQMYIGGFNSPTDQFNTNLADVASNAYDPADPSYDTVNNLPWTSYINGAFNGVPNTGNTGGTFSHNLSNSFDISKQGGSPTATPNPNEAVNVANSNYTPSSALAVYQTFLPHFPSGYITTLNNRAAAIIAATPAAGSTFGASVTSGSFTMSVTSGSAPAVNSVVNGPGIPSGDVVSSVSGSTITLATKATANETAQTYGTGAMNPDGTYNGALFPADNSGVVAWNDGTVFNPAATHTPAR